MEPGETGRKRHRYFVLTPTTLSIFSGEDDAWISDAGFLRGLTNADDEVPPGVNVGVCIALDKLESVGNEGTRLTITLTEGHTVEGPGGSPVGAIVAECANMEIADGWAGAVRAQWEAGVVEAPRRVPRSQQPHRGRHRQPPPSPRS